MGRMVGNAGSQDKTSHSLKGDQKVQTSSCKKNHGDVMYNMVTGANNNRIAYQEVAKRVDLKSSCHKKKRFVTMYGDKLNQTSAGDHSTVYPNHYAVQQN